MDNLNLSFLVLMRSLQWNFKKITSLSFSDSPLHTLSLTLNLFPTHPHPRTHTNNNTHSHSFSAFYLTLSLNICNILSLSLFLNTHYISLFLHLLVYLFSLSVLTCSLSSLLVEKNELLSKKTFKSLTLNYKFKTFFAELGKEVSKNISLSNKFLIKIDLNWNSRIEWWLDVKLKRGTS